jgi:hypothetical protein
MWKKIRSIFANDEKQAAFQAWSLCAQLIAAGKVQRWEVLKWSISIDIAVVTANQFLKGDFGCFAPLLAMMTSIVGVVLLNHYNRRITGARRLAAQAQNRLTDLGLNISALQEKISPRGGPPKPTSSFVYDVEELLLYKAILLVGLAVVFGLVLTQDWPHLYFSKTDYLKGFVLWIFFIGWLFLLVDFAKGLFIAFLDTLGGMST